MHLRTALGFALLSSVVGCSDGGPPPPESIGEITEPIVGGSLDPGHDATVFVQFGNSGACSGTIINVTGNVGYVLTAAHCFPSGAPQFVLQADNLQMNPIQYPVVSSAVHPSYNPNNSHFDFGIIQFSGASAATPFVPVLGPAVDSIGSGDNVDLSGYGVTQAGGNPSSSRRHVAVDLIGCAGLGLGANSDNVFICYDQGNGSGVGVGACNGDSGGPAYAFVGGAEYVVGVTSFGDGQCNDYGVSGRASVAIDFITNFMTGQGGGSLTCDQCIDASTNGMGACVGSVDACLNNASCNALVTCFNNCASGDQACYQQCATQNPNGVGLYNAIFDCVCDTGCVTECAMDPLCTGPACGFTANATCQTCFEASCCAEASACADDPVCGTCFGNSPDPGCPNALADAFLGCLQDNCAQQCGVGGGGGAGGSGTGGSIISPGGSGGSMGAGASMGTGATGTGGDGTGATGPGGQGTGGDGTGANNGTGSDGSCNCSVPGEDQSRSPLGLLGLLGLVALGTRRRARRA